MENKLFSPLKFGSITLKNHMVMAPMTRNRATADNVPVDLMAEYYAQRAGAGLIITEGTSPSPNGLGYPFIPGIYNSAQIAGWKKVTDAVHDKDGHIFIQLMHTGRVTAQENLPAGAEVLAPSAIAAKGEMYTRKYIIAGVVAVIIITPRFWGAVSVYFFTVGDNLNLLYLWDPLIIWGLLGLFFGIAYGGFVACKKYKLDYKYAVMPVLLLLTVLVLLFLNNRFLKSHTGLVQLPVIDSVKKRDSTLLVPVIKHKRRRHHKLIMPQKPDSSVNSLDQNPSN